ncbi:putative hydro-lyase [Terribacillus saccharophilus]|uniref:putative hydro-lyase n=1 Tax=Terribacillus saccharophilus TaxID=361277 RepID=UPI003D2AC4FD
MNPSTIREKIRSGEHNTHTSGLGSDYVQANLAIVPKEYAFDFLLFANRNPKSCPIIDVLEPGVVESALAAGSDIRSDIPLYFVYENGKLTEKRQDLKEIWRDDFVSFLIGCSFTFESALLKEGVPLKHIEQNRNVAMYITNRQTKQAGEFSGPVVVSMRPIKNELVQKAIDVTAQFPNMHGSPIHVGDPKEIGIDDISKPDFGEFTEFGEGETPVFWECGVTPQSAAIHSQIPFVITHAPGHMFITDVTNDEFLRNNS